MTHPQSCACGVPSASVCLCAQLSIPSDPDRARTLWLGSVEEHESEYDLAELFAARLMFENNSSSSSSKNTSIVEEDKSVMTVEKVVIRRNRFAAISVGGKKWDSRW